MVTVSGVKPMVPVSRVKSGSCSRDSHIKAVSGVNTWWLFHRLTHGGCFRG